MSRLNRKITTKTWQTTWDSPREKRRTMITMVVEHVFLNDFNWFHMISYGFVWFNLTSKMARWKIGRRLVRPRGDESNTHRQEPARPRGGHGDWKRDQWEFQDPKMEVLYHIGPYIWQVPPINRFLKWPLNGFLHNGNWLWKITIFNRSINHF